MVRIRPKEALQRHRFDVIKEHVSVEVLARDLIDERAGRLKTAGGELRGLCVVCGNGNHSQAFSASLEKNLWTCFACGAGGDVVDLAALALEMPPAMAVTWLAHRYNVELPERPDSWHEKQSRQARLRERVEAERREIKRRRLFKYLILPELERVPAAEREKETALAWERFKKMPLYDWYGDARG